MMRTSFMLSSLLVILCGLSLSACGLGIKTEAKYPTGNRQGNQNNDIYTKQDSIFDGSGLSILGSNDDQEKSSSNGIQVNGFLWRASLDTVSFMPLASADPFGGTIITEWYATEESADERFKLNVFITERELKANGVKVTAFKQVRQNGEWVDVSPNKGTARALEDTILTRARQLKIAKIGQ